VDVAKKSLDAQGTHGKNLFTKGRMKLIANVIMRGMINNELLDFIRSNKLDQSSKNPVNKRGI
jgi:hypothetical protein